jgi:hypothetical protein
MGTEYQWNDADWGIQKYSQKYLSHRHFVCNKCRMDMPGTEPRPLQWIATSAMVWLTWLAADWVTWYPSLFLSPQTFCKWTVLHYNCGGTIWMGHASPCGICGGQTGTRTGSSPSTSVFPCQYHSTIAPHSFIYHQCCTNLATDSILKQRLEKERMTARCGASWSTKTRLHHF